MEYRSCYKSINCDTCYNYVLYGYRNYFGLYRNGNSDSDNVCSQAWGKKA